MNHNDIIYLAGHTGLVGSAIHRALKSRGFGPCVITAPGRRSQEYGMDLRDQQEVNRWFRTYRPKYVFLAAAVVGGIGANQHHPARFIGDNLAIQTNVINAAYENGCEKFMFLGSSCIYPRLAPQPMTEDCLLTGPLEPTNQAYAVAKIAGITMCQSYAQEYGFNAISVMPTNLYGPGDNFGLESSHVIPALIRKFHDARVNGDESVTIWGTGQPMREFLHVDDLADACVFLMEQYDSSDIVNIGSGDEISIRDLAVKIKKVVGFEGDVVCDADRPDGAPRKLLDTSKLESLGWKPQIALSEGLQSTYQWYLSANPDTLSADRL